MPSWSILNQPLPEPSHAEKEPEQRYIHTMTGPWACVHWDHLAVMLPPAATGAESAAEVPPLQRIAAALTWKMGS